MFIINDILISEDLIEQQFTCHLEHCKGACCQEGDFGAPLEPEEIEILHTLLPQIESTLSIESREVLENEGFNKYYNEKDCFGTTLVKDGACLFMTRDIKGIARCTIEQNFEKGNSNFKKPISCHLYPVRIQTLKATRTEALNYDQWDICSPACIKGIELNIPVYKFVKDALKRRYGSDFYDALDAIANHYGKNKV